MEELLIVPSGQRAGGPQLGPAVGLRVVGGPQEEIFEPVKGGERLLAAGPLEEMENLDLAGPCWRIVEEQWEELAVVQVVVPEA